MPWDIKTLEEMKKGFIKQFTQPGANKAEVCRMFGISRKTGYKWLKRYQTEGEAGLRERSRRPLSRRVQLEEETITRIVEIRVKHPSWGAEKIKACMKREGRAEVPGRATIHRILKQCSLLRAARKRRARVKNIRLEGSGKEVEEVNEEWTIDFKGWWMSRDGKRKCYPLTIRDAKSRYILGVTLLEDMKEGTVKSAMIEVFKKYGLPERIRSDCGVPFANVQAVLMLSRLSIWWIKLGIEPVRGRVGCPQDNGAHERMHLDMKRELEAERVDTQSEIDEWVHTYNYERPHEALGEDTPGEHYKKSRRAYLGREGEYDYKGMETRSIDAHGEILWHGMEYFVSEALRGERVGVKELEGEIGEIWFWGYKLGRIDEKIEAWIPMQERSTKVRIIKGRERQAGGKGREDGGGKKMQGGA